MQKRLDISFVDENNQKHYPVIIHSAVSGGIERYLYMIFDNFEKSFPIWLHPIQLRLIAVSEKYVDYCLKLAGKYKNIRIDIDDRNESVSKKIKDSKKDLVPNFIVIGEKEQKEDAIELDKVIKSIIKDSKNKPFISLEWPMKVSQQVR